MKPGRKTVPIALTVAGSDSGGGAGIQADLKTFAAREVWGLTAITLVTAQNTAGVIDIHFLPTDVVSSQLMVLNDDFDISAAKTGALGTADLILLVAKWFDAHPVPWLIVDPVAVSKHNDSLIEKDAISVLIRELIPQAHVLTPNIHEVKALTGMDVFDEKTALEAGQQLIELGPKAAVIKNVPIEEHYSYDILVMEGSHEVIESPRIHSTNLHGSGCSFSACITAELAKGVELVDAVRTAKLFVAGSIASGPKVGSGNVHPTHQFFSWYGFPNELPR